MPRPFKKGHFTLKNRDRPDIFSSLCTKMIHADNFFTFLDKVFLLFGTAKKNEKNTLNVEFITILSELYCF